MRNLLLAFSTVLVSVSAAAAGHYYVGSSVFFQYNQSSLGGSYTGLYPELAFGYGGLSGNYYLAAEVFAMPFAAQLGSSTENNEINVRIQRSIGASLMPGIKLSDDTILFLRFGLKESMFPGPDTYGKGIQLGFGFLLPLSDAWDFRGEYNYTAYSDVTGLGFVRTDELGIGLIYNIDRKPPQPDQPVNPTIHNPIKPALPENTDTKDKKGTTAGSTSAENKKMPENNKNADKPENTDNNTGNTANPSNAGGTDQ